jgi:hypothetical protein
MPPRILSGLIVKIISRYQPFISTESKPTRFLEIIDLWVRYPLTILFSHGNAEGLISPLFLHFDPLVRSWDDLRLVHRVQSTSEGQSAPLTRE